METEVVEVAESTPIIKTMAPDMLIEFSKPFWEQQIKNIVCILYEHSLEGLVKKFRRIKTRGVLGVSLLPRNYECPIA